MSFVLKHRYTEKNRFSDICELVDHLKQQEEIVLDIQNIQDIKPSPSGDWCYIGTVKYVTCVGYEEAIYVASTLKGELESLIKELQDIASPITL